MRAPRRKCGQIGAWTQLLRHSLCLWCRRIPSCGAVGYCRRCICAAGCCTTAPHAHRQRLDIWAQRGLLLLQCCLLAARASALQEDAWRAFTALASCPAAAISTASSAAAATCAQR